MSVKHSASRRPAPLVPGLALAAAVALLLGATVGASTASATHLTDTGSPGGPTVPWGFNDGWGLHPGGWSADLTTEQIELAGAITPDSVSTARLTVNWRDVEFTQDQYDWERSDRAYQAMQANSVDPVMLIFQSPEWARVPGATCPAANPCAFPPASEHDPEWSEFVHDAAARYPEVRAIEVWNEPNLPRFWAPAPDPARYAQVLALAHDAAVAAGSGAPVITAGLSPVRTTSGTHTSSRVFLRETYNQGSATDFEGIGAHSYPRVEPLVDEMWRELDRLFAVRDNQGDVGTPLWITEVSVSSDATDGVGTTRQGEELVRLYRSIEGHEVESFIIHRLHDVATETPYWNHTGVVGEDLLAKPVYCELGWAIGEAACPAPVAVDDQATVDEDSGPIPLDVLANDTQFEGSPTAIDTTTQPPNGTVQVTPGGAGLSYEPDPNYCNDPPGDEGDEFDYMLKGGSQATVAVTVTCVDDETPVPPGTSDEIPAPPATIADTSGIASLADDSVRVMRGRIPLEIACDQGEDCKGAVEVKTANPASLATALPSRKRIVVLAHETAFSIPAGESEPVRAKLTRKGKKLLKEKLKVKAAVTINTEGADGDRTATWRLNLKRKKKT